MIQYAKQKTKSPAAVAAAVRAEDEPGSNKSLSPNGGSETHATPSVNSTKQGTVNDNYDLFVARCDYAEIRELLREASNHPAAHQLERALLESPDRGVDRMTLASLAQADMRETFVATVAGRGFGGKQRTVMLKDLKMFGSKFIQEDHLWLRYNKLWERIEPFFQGQKVILVGTAVAYTRKDRTTDYTLALEHVTKL